MTHTRILDDLVEEDHTGKSEILETQGSNSIVIPIEGYLLPQTTSNEGQQRHLHQQRIGNYDFIRTIGEGSFAKVKLGIHRLTGEKVAIKVIDKRTLLDTYSLAHLHREAQIMRLLDHPHVVQLIEVMETKKELYLVLEYAAGGEVLDYIVAHGRLRESEARKLFRQVVNALIYCHDHNVVHRDLKAENLLLNENMEVKISDFGLSNVFDKGKQLLTCCGSPVYSAPELIEGKRYIGPEVDAWSLGVNLYAMVVGDLPFSDKELKRLYDKVLNGHYEMPEFVSVDCRDLISRLLTLNPAHRITLAKVLQHPWMQAHSRPGTWAESPEELGIPPHVIPHLRPKNAHEMDNEIMQKLETLGYETVQSTKDIVAGKFNQAAGTYHILAIKKHREGGFITPSVKLLDKSKDQGDSKASENVKGPERTARAASNLTSDELARILIKAERTRVLTRAKDIALRGIHVSTGKKRDSKSENEGDTTTAHHNGVQVSSKSPRRRSKTSNPLPPPPPNLLSGPRTSATDKISSRRGSVDGAVPPAALFNGRRISTETQESRKSTSTSDRRLSFSQGEMALRTNSTHTNGKPAGGKQLARRSMSVHADDTKAAKASLSEGAQANHGSLPPIHMTTEVTAHPDTSRNSTAKGEVELPASSLRVRRVRSRTITIDESLYLTKELDRDPDPKTAPTYALHEEPPRTIRFAFNCYTTTTLPPQILFRRLLETLGRNNIEFVMEGYLCACELGQIRFEAEVCKLPRLHVYGLRLKRMCGDMWEYKEICQTITEELDL